MYFIFDKQCYLQYKSLAIGILIFFVFTNLYIAYNKENFIIKFNIYIRYIDNIFVLTNCKKKLSKVHYE